MKQLAGLHQKVIHTHWDSVTSQEVELEDIWVKKYPYNTLEGVCGECFGDVDRFVTQDMEIDLDVANKAR